MNTFLNIELDTVDIWVPGKDLHLPGTTTAELRTDDRELKNSYQNRKEIRGTYKAHSLQVRTMNQGSVLTVYGSPYAYKYGQNAFLPGNVRYACEKALSAVCSRYSLIVDETDINLKRVDLVLNFRLGSQDEVDAAIRQIKFQLAAHDAHIECHPHYVLWKPENGREYAIRFYAKWHGMRSSRRANTCPEHDRLVRECEGILRVELQLRAEGLRSLGLDKASAWYEGSAEEAVRKYMKRLPRLDITSGVLKDEELDALPSRLRAAFVVHKTGNDLEKVFGKRTLQRYRSAFRKLGIDLTCPNQPVQTTIALKSLLAPNRVLKGPPQWLKEAGLYPKN